MEFENWLVSEGLSPSTVKKYVGAINGPLTKWSIDHNITSKPLNTVTDFEEFEMLSDMIEGTGIFAERNSRGNHMYGAALNNYARYLAQQGKSATGAGAPASPFNDQIRCIEQVEAGMDPFDPNDKDDARERVLRAVVRRRGQPKFRSNLITAYEGRCAITNCPVLEILEAAHVTPYLGPQTNAVSNGLLLRADIHTLWDLGIVAIDPTRMTVVISSNLHDPNYQALAGSSVFQPVALSSRVSRSALAQQWGVFLETVNSGMPGTKPELLKAE